MPNDLNVRIDHLTLRRVQGVIAGATGLLVFTAHLVAACLQLRGNQIYSTLWWPQSTYADRKPIVVTEMICKFNLQTSCSGIFHTRTRKGGYLWYLILLSIFEPRYANIKELHTARRNLTQTKVFQSKLVIKFFAFSVHSWIQWQTKRQIKNATKFASANVSLKYKMKTYTHKTIL